MPSFSWTLRHTSIVNKEIPDILNLSWVYLLKLENTDILIYKMESNLYIEAKLKI